MPYLASDRDLDLRWWAAANYLTVAQIYLRENPLLRRPLEANDIKPRLLGHWGTSPGLSMIYTLLNRLIRDTGTDCIYVTGPGHGGPALVANTYLEGTYSEIYPAVSPDADGVLRLVRQFSTPGGIPSHVSVQTPGSIHEGGELGYALAHAAGAAFDHPDLLVACVVGDGEAETGPLAASWKIPAFLNARRDGAVLPILHLNGYKISGATVLGRADDADVIGLLHAQGWDPVIVAGDDPEQVFTDLNHALTHAYEQIRDIQRTARSSPAAPARARWPAIILRTPKGWTGPDTVDGVQVQGTFRAHQVPLSGVRENPEHLRVLEEWLRSYRPEELFDADGRLAAEVSALAPPGDKRMSASPYANGGRLRTPLTVPPLESYALRLDGPGRLQHESTRPFGELLRDVYAATTRSSDGGGTFRLFCPDETASNRLDAVFDVTDRCLQATVLDSDDHLSPDGRVMEVLSEHLCQGWLEGYLLSGRHGLFATYEAFAMVSASMLVQHTKWLQHAADLPWRTSVSSLNVLLTSTCWRNDHNGFSHQGPGLIDTAIPLAPGVVRIWLPPDANCTLSIGRHCLNSVDHVNLIVVDKQLHLQYLDLDDAERHCAEGASVWDWAGTEAIATGQPDEPDIVLAAAGDVPTLEILAAAQLLREHVPYLRVRVVNLVDLMGLLPPADHPHGFSDDKFERLFTASSDVIFAFHGYPRAVHELLHGRINPGRFHVRGFVEQGTTTTPFDMVVLNRMSRYHLVLEALRRSRRAPEHGEDLARFCDSQLARHHAYVREHFEDLPRDSQLDLVVVALILALNPGSSSLKAALRDPSVVLDIAVDRLATDAATMTIGDVRQPFAGDLAAAVDAIADEVAGRGLVPTAVVHRVVHGGPDHFDPTVVDDGLLADLRAAVPLAPLHLPGDLESIDRARHAWPEATHVACFDTGFHRDLPERSRRLPVPSELVQLGVRRYGFHGLSVQSALGQLPDLGGAVIAHLGSGCSASAVQDGRPRHTTMSLTPTGGMVSATRTGDLDPEIVLYLIEEHGYSVERLRRLLDRSSGVAGITGGRHDMRDLGHVPDAELAVDVFVTSAAMAIAGCATTLDRWDALVFTGGIGENDDDLRQQICRELLVVRGVSSTMPPADALAEAGVRIHVVAADEAAVMDRLARRLIAAGSGSLTP